jgi:hypothetical protein
VSFGPCFASGAFGRSVAWIAPLLNPNASYPGAARGGKALGGGAGAETGVKGGFGGDLVKGAAIPAPCSGNGSGGAGRRGRLADSLILAVNCVRFGGGSPNMHKDTATNGGALGSFYGSAAFFRFLGLLGYKEGA